MNIFEIPRKIERVRVAKALAKVADQLENTVIHFPSASAVEGLRQELKTSVFEGGVQSNYARKIAIALDFAQTNYHRNGESLYNNILAGKRIYLKSYQPLEMR